MNGEGLDGLALYVENAGFWGHSVGALEVPYLVFLAQFACGYFVVDPGHPAFDIPQIYPVRKKREQNTCQFIILQHEKNMSDKSKSL